MAKHIRIGRLRHDAFLILALAMIAGCGDDLEPRYPVSGKVTRQGQPLNKGTITFLPKDTSKARSAAGEIQADGSYTLTSKDPGDGAMAGEYHVIVNVVDVDDSKVDRMPSGKPMLNQPHKVKIKSLIPTSFSDPSKTELKATVETHANVIPFDLNK